jgi:hypothetical protein
MEIIIEKDPIQLLHEVQSKETIKIQISVGELLKFAGDIDLEQSLHEIIQVVKKHRLSSEGKN